MSRTNLQQVHLRVNDAATGKPTPVRLRITDAAGTYYAPYGRLTEFAIGLNQDVGGNVLIGTKKWTYIDGACEILLPPGKLHVEITKGFEYKPLDEEITLQSGKMSLRFTIERWCDKRKQGWYSGDTRAHFLSPDAALLEGQAEGVAVVNVLATEYERAIPNILSFSGQAFARQASDCGVAVNTLNRARGLGQLGLLNCHRIVYPLTFEMTADNDWTLADWCDQCHRKKGLVVWTNPRLGESGSFHGEGLADLILGKIDAVEITESTFASVLSAYHVFCEADFIPALVAASGKCANCVQLGSPRTYVHLPQPTDFTYPNWIESIRSGRTFVSAGPLLHFSINGEVPAKNYQADPTSEISVYAEAESWLPFDQLQVIRNGQIAATTQPTSSQPYQAKVEYKSKWSESGWCAVRCLHEGQTVAHSSAWAIRLSAVPAWVRHVALLRLDQDVEAMSRWMHDKQRPRLSHVLGEARTLLAKKLSS